MDKKTYKDSLLYWCRKYPEPMGGYSTAFNKWIQQDHQECNKSCGNGAAMRVSPIGWLFDDYYEIQEVGGIKRQLYIPGNKTGKFL